MCATEKLWDFSIRTYDTDGVSDACLTLQAEQGVDVNMLLYCCWAGSAYGELSDEMFDAALQLSRSWAKEVVRPLREVRTRMKHASCNDHAVPAASRMQLRENIKRVELEAEKLQQTALEALAPPSVQLLPASDQLRYAAANLRRYCRAEAMKITGESLEQLSLILAAGFPPATRNSTRESLI